MTRPLESPGLGPFASSVPAALAARRSTSNWRGMPNCFQLLRNGEAVALTEIDDELRLHFGEPADPDQYFREWYSCIGRDLAMGRTFAEIRTIYAGAEWTDSGLRPVAEWLAANFTARSWYEPSSWSKR